MKLNYIKQENPAAQQEADVARIYEEELEINDFPQQARWRITSKVFNFFKFYLISRFFEQTYLQFYLIKGNYKPYL
jgi:hypothetical protein